MQTLQFDIMTTVPAVDPAEIVAYVGRVVIAAAEQTERVDTETAAYDALAYLLTGTHDAPTLLTLYPALDPIREVFLQFAERLQSVFHQPTH